MTAEAAVLNHEAVALAADSAVSTVSDGGTKTFTSATKMFGLSFSEPVGVMIYGSTNAGEIPWETVIKTYRDQLGTTSFPTVAEYANDFFSFVESHPTIFSAAAQRDRVEDVTDWLFSDIIGEVVARARVLHRDQGRISRREISRLTSEVVNERHAEWKAADAVARITTAKETAIKKLYTPVFKNARLHHFRNVKLRPTAARQLSEIATWLHTREVQGFRTPFGTGFVFAGFGLDEYLPAMTDVWLEGVVDGVLSVTAERVTRIGDNLTAAIVPFAQVDMVYAFMEGVQPNHQAVMDAIVEVLTDDIPARIVDDATNLAPATKKKVKDVFAGHREGTRDAMRKVLADHRAKDHANPTLRAVSMLPKDELAAMAEALVNLTSFRRRVSLETETVGGPIDVALISKGDGLVWIRRKQYFSRDLNPHFITSRYSLDHGNE